MIYLYVKHTPPTGPFRDLAEYLRYLATFGRDMNSHEGEK